MKTEKQFISILSDYGFKVTFANKADTSFLRKSLAALIGTKYKIKQVTFLRNEVSPITEKARGSIYDLICIDERDNSFIVEMQLSHEKHFIQRAKYYAFHRLNTLIRKGPYRFNDLKKIYCISLLAKNMYPDSKQYYHFGTLKNQVNEEIDSQITHIIVEISKFEKALDDLSTDLDKLIYFMKNLQQLIQEADLPKTLSEDWIKKAMDRLDKSNMSPEDRMAYEMMMARNASEIALRKREDKELAEQVTEQVNIEHAKKMKAEGISLELIAKITGFTIEEIEVL